MKQWLYNFFFTTRLPLRYELTLVIFLKLTLIIFIWWLCFSHPPLPPLNSDYVSEHLLFEPIKPKESL